MPTMILTFAWLLATTTHLAAAPPLSTLALTIVTPADACQPPVLIALPTDAEAGERGWMLLESDNDEETDDETESTIGAPLLSWPAVRSPFGVVASNPHPTVLPRSALRSRVLRC